MRRFSLGLVLALFLVMTPAVGATERGAISPVPGFDLVAWVLDWFRVAETVKAEFGPGIEPGGSDDPSSIGTSPALAQNGVDESPETAMGPGLEPGG